MFGKTNWKQEIKDKEQEIASYQSQLEQAKQMLGKMSLMWIDAGQRVSEMERSQRELERQLRQITSAVEGISIESKHQLENNQRILRKAEELAERQESLKEEQEQAQEASGDIEEEKLVSLTKIIAPITAELSNGMDEMRRMLEDVVELGRQMGVLSLNAAVEAGRMGEGGMKFVEAAEEIRGMSDKYQQATSALAQQMQIVGMKWQKSKGEIEEVEGRLKQQYEQLEEARCACAAVGEEMLNLPIEELREEMQKALENEELKERCQDVTEKMEKAEQGFQQHQETWGSLRQTAADAKAFIKDIQA